MEGQTRSLTPAEFVTELSSGALDAVPPGGLVLSGMAKPAEGNDQAILFAHGTSCTDWVEIPVAQIESVEVLRTVRCRDHAHPLVKLHLKAPQSDEGMVFAALTRSLAGRVGGQRRIVRRPKSPSLGNLSGAVPAASGMTGGCADVNDYEIDGDGQVWCLDWCWEHDGYTEAAFSKC
jgi:hypothetical protein